jgi:hypothetical protein
VVSDVARAVHALELETEEPTRAGQEPPASAAPATVTPSGENAFVAGEIDVPQPKPGVEFEAASRLLGNAEPADPDTGNRTPKLERGG